MTEVSAAAPFEAIPTVSIGAEGARDLAGWLARLATEHGPIFRVVWRPDWAWHPVYLVGPEANRFVLHTGRGHFSHGLGWTPIVGGLLGKGLLNMDGDEHAWHRKLMNPAFTTAYMGRYLPIMGRIIAERTGEWRARGEVDLYEEARKITFDVAAEALTGLPAGAEADRLRDLFLTLLYPGATGAAGQDDGVQRWLGARDEVTARLATVIAARRRAPTDDLLGMLAGARDGAGRPLSAAQLLAHVMILLVTGHETSTTLSAWLLFLLATHPDYLARVRAELDALLGPGDGLPTLDAIKAMRLLGNALSEAGRLYSPVVNGPRGVVAPFVFGGYAVPAGARVRYPIAAGHRLPAIFHDPDRFDPDRFAPPREEDKRHPYALIPFGGGPRICIGVNFATVEIKALAAHVLRAYTLEPVGPTPAQGYGPILGSPMAGIRVRVTDRSQ